MNKEYRKAFNALKKMGCPVFIHTDAPTRFDISAEESNSDEWASFYNGDYQSGWIFGVNPKVNEVLSKHGLFAEWMNPAHLRVYEI